ncbi:hypothetical protein B0H17DRAFT_448257 [Mycena rosella]|uniref:Non-specific serine/threonine protein kinase n=1 Tax=Mycena rosella TaxID=1033263 RepID=A0AAD7CD41_MYCRO|nr:hypothetical protein B0H17DRAFT_448257 [Mycena rosella]
MPLWHGFLRDARPPHPIRYPLRCFLLLSGLLLTYSPPVFDQRPRCIIRHSPILPLSGPNARPGFIALLIGMLLPSSAVPYPAFNTKSPTWQFFCKTVASPPQWMLIEPRYRLDAGSGGGNSGGGGEGGNGGPIDSGGGGGKSSGARDVPRNGGSQKRTHEPSTEGERDPKKPRMEEGKQSDATSDMHGVLTRGSYLILESPGGEVTRCAIWGVDDALEFMRSARPTPDITFSSQSELPTLALTNPLNSRRPGTVWAGVVAGRQVIVKRFQPAEYDELATELGAHQCLVPLWPKIVSCDAVIAPLDCAWMALVMEDRGLSIASRGGFAANPWHKLTNLYRTIEAVHAAGVKHGDLAARNVVVTPSGDLCLIDFGEATLEHLCAGQSCPELVLFQNIMDGEDGEDSEGNNSSS